MLALILSVVFVPLSQCIQSSSNWTYVNNGALKWPSLGYPFCDGQRQSPINLAYSRSEYFPGLEPVRILVNPELYARVQTFKLVRLRHSINIDFPPNLFTVSLNNSDAGGDYEAVGLHFHWASESAVGSEHLLDGQQYPLETHIVCFNKRIYPTARDAISSVDGLTALGILSQEVSTSTSSTQQFDIIDRMRPGLEQLVNTNVSDTQVEKFNLNDAFRGINPASYYRYAGSLTTPPCTPNVAWTVFINITQVSTSQLDLLRLLKMSDNYRPVQPLNLPRGEQHIPRTLWRSFNNGNRLVQSTLMKSISGNLSIVLLLMLDLLRLLKMSDNYRPVQPLNLPRGEQHIPRTLWRSFNNGNRLVQSTLMKSISGNLSIVLLLMLDLLRLLKMSDNYRPVQPLNLPRGEQHIPRTLWRSFNNGNRLVQSTLMKSISGNLSIVLLLMVNRIIVF